MTEDISEAACVYLDGDERMIPLNHLHILASLSSASLESMANAAVSELMDSPTLNEKVVEPKTQNDQVEFAAMCAIVAACAREGGAQTLAEQRRQLYALGVQDEALQTKLLPILAAVVPRVERVLETTNFDFAHVVDVFWRLDYVLRSSGTGSVNEPVYFVQLQYQSPQAKVSQLQTLTFTCSVEELRELVYRIQEAVNEIDKFVEGHPSELVQ